MFNIDMICCVRKENKNFKQLQTFINTVKQYPIPEIILRIVDKATRAAHVKVFEYIIHDINRILGKKDYTSILSNMKHLPSSLWKMLNNFKDTIISRVPRYRNSESSPTENIDTSVDTLDTSLLPTQSTICDEFSLEPTDSQSTRRMSSTAPSISPYQSSIQHNTSIKISSTVQLTPLQQILSNISSEFRHNKLANLTYLQTHFSQANITKVLQNCVNYVHLNKLPSVSNNTLSKGAPGMLQISYEECACIFSAILLTSEFDDKINFDYWLIHWPERIKCIFAFLLAIIDSDDHQINKNLQLSARL